MALQPFSYSLFFFESWCELFFFRLWGDTIFHLLLLAFFLNADYGWSLLVQSRTLYYQSTYLQLMQFVPLSSLHRPDM